MLRGERVVLRPIQRADLPRLSELLEDLEVKVLRETGPVVPISLARYEARFDQEAATPARDRVWFAVETDGELIGGAACTGSTTSTVGVSLASALARASGARAWVRMRCGRWSTTPSRT
jgi:hypothetical protein